MAVSEELLEKYRHFNVEHTDWWDYIYEDFKERMSHVGVAVDNIYFSGFWSQGDGACFEGRIDDMQAYLTKHFPEPDCYPYIKKLIDAGGTIMFNLQHRGHYYHENSITASINADEFWQVMSTPTEFHEQIIKQWDEQLSQEIGEFETDVLTQLQGYMRELYRDLEAEYDHLTSDEAVAEAIEANELTTIDEGE
jgi:hypothetical protein